MWSFLRVNLFSIHHTSSIIIININYYFYFFMYMYVYIWFCHFYIFLHCKTFCYIIFLYFIINYCLYYYYYLKPLWFNGKNCSATTIAHIHTLHTYLYICIFVFTITNNVSYYYHHCRHHHHPYYCQPVLFHIFIIIVDIEK